MSRFIVCSNSQSRIAGGGILRTSENYGEYDNLEAAIKRMKEIASNGVTFSHQVTKYFVNELAPPNTYPMVIKSYNLS
jgi:hypothetical protein